ncbi:hypothetical protein VTG60DRAFT_885 [Thermothelomyces hinnuleus]
MRWGCRGKSSFFFSFLFFFYFISLSPFFLSSSLFLNFFLPPPTLRLYTTEKAAVDPSSSSSTYYFPIHNRTSERPSSPRIQKAWRLLTPRPVGKKSGPWEPGIDSTQKGKFGCVSGSGTPLEMGVVDLVRFWKKTIYFCRVWNSWLLFWSGSFFAWQAGIPLVAGFGGKGGGES